MSCDALSREYMGACVGDLMHSIAKTNADDTQKIIYRSAIGTATDPIQPIQKQLGP